MKQKHTPGPWRWEFNNQSKRLILVGGRKRYDDTVMDFTRWGLISGVPRFTDEGLLHRACDRPEWIKPFPGLEHRAKWCADFTHPDACLIAAAPDLLAALRAVLETLDDNDNVASLRRIARDAGMDAVSIFDFGVDRAMETIIKWAIAKAEGAEE